MDIEGFHQFVRQAAESRKVVRFDYTKKDGTRDTYIVEPYEIREDGFWARKVNEIPPKGIRKFFIENIENLVMLEATYDPIWPIKII